MQWIGKVNQKIPVREVLRKRTIGRAEKVYRAVTNFDELPRANCATAPGGTHYAVAWEPCPPPNASNTSTAEL